MNEIYKDKNWLINKYWKNKLDQNQIASLGNCHSITILRWMQKLNIPVRTKSEAAYKVAGNYLDLSLEAMDFINGELLGDGCVVSYSKSSAQFNYSSKYEEYLNWLSIQLNKYGIKQSGKIHKCYTKWGLAYQYQSCSYKPLQILRKKWYPNGKKIIPKDIKLTGLSCRQWYIGDGSLEHNKRGKDGIRLATNGFRKRDVLFFINLMGKKGIKAKRLKSNVIRISTISTKDFLQFIGDCPISCYKYKWQYQDNRLQKRRI